MAIVVNLSSCKTEGCTDPDSINYNADANKDDGSCAYQGSVVFWYGKATSEFLISADINALTFYVDNKIIGSTNASVYWKTHPTCKENGSITATMNLGGLKTQSYEYKVVDAAGTEIWKGTVNFNANQCLALELTSSRILGK